jgi:hypothetical protein
MARLYGMTLREAKRMDSQEIKRKDVAGHSFIDARA